MLDNKQKMCDLLSNVSVIGAAGKMGRGISLLLIQAMAKHKLSYKNNEYQPSIYLVDNNPKSFHSLNDYIKSNLSKFAERNINQLRESCAEDKTLVDNIDIVNAFINEALSMIQMTSDLTQISESKTIFEAVIENLELKTELYTKLRSICRNDAYFFSNTSSIPISLINEKASLDNRILGFHFYNPPPVQKLVELIRTPNTDDKLVNAAHEIATILNKTIIVSNDTAGFIGNGFFAREGSYALSKITELSEYSLTESIYLINKVTSDFLLRPLGIFQLIDYVGIDVFKMIFEIMDTHIADESFYSELIDNYLEAGITGGQTTTGSQKDGFFQYDEKSNIIGIYDPNTKSYHSADDIFKQQIQIILGHRPFSALSWRDISKDTCRDNFIQKYFSELKNERSFGSELARQFIVHGAQVAHKLVADKVAETEQDVNRIMTMGFHHLYGPCNQFMEDE
ncbi:MAG: 3-hydroxyacyl-CoA dehydrogenase family protein [Lentisphaeria bacterium]|nr:3-hydroxyacyl-CoA dehydrogenase family protein [Lentisphaeria bacterium]NQZ67842.1 3-hydroxyacyl-CoA dehydrogenase family protein [Lentisphaeria bacterium]